MNGSIKAKVPTGVLPIASGMMPDSSKYYVSNYVDSTITCISIGAKACRDGKKQGGHQDDPAPRSATIRSPATTRSIRAAAAPPSSAALPIQTPVSPNGKYMITANTLTATITIIDTDTDTVVQGRCRASAGCHGVNFGAKKGGGYYAYVSSKFSNDSARPRSRSQRRRQPDRRRDRGPQSSWWRARTRKTDDTPTLHKGMGGQGVLPIPVVYNGWVQKLPAHWKAKLTHDQRHPIN